MTDAARLFDRHADHYEAQRHVLVPGFEAFYATAVDALALAGRPVARVLDLGAGTGLLARRVAAAYPDAELTLLDGSPRMLDGAREELGERAGYVVADLLDPLPAGPWDAVVSALAIHHLPHDGKVELMSRVHTTLAPGGVFVNAEQVAGPSARLDAAYSQWHEHRSRALGATDDQWAGAVERMREDRCADVGQQLAWLRDAGFDDVDCLLKDHRFAVLVARRSI